MSSYLQNYNEGAINKKIEVLHRHRGKCSHLKLFITIALKTMDIEKMKKSWKYLWQPAKSYQTSILPWLALWQKHVLYTLNYWNLAKILLSSALASKIDALFLILMPIAYSLTIGNCSFFSSHFNIILSFLLLPCFSWISGGYFTWQWRTLCWKRHTSYVFLILTSNLHYKCAGQSHCCSYWLIINLYFQKDENNTITRVKTINCSITSSKLSKHKSFHVNHWVHGSSSFCRVVKASLTWGRAWIPSALQGIHLRVDKFWDSRNPRPRRKCRASLAAAPREWLEMKRITNCITIRVLCEVSSFFLNSGRAQTLTDNCVTVVLAVIVAASLP